MVSIFIQLRHVAVQWPPYTCIILYAATAALVLLRNEILLRNLLLGLLAKEQKRKLPSNKIQRIKLIKIQAKKLQKIKHKNSQKKSGAINQKSQLYKSLTKKKTLKQINAYVMPKNIW